MNLKPRDYPMPGAGPGRPRGKVLPVPRAEGVVEPARYDRMHAPVWKPQPAVPARAGSMDFLRYPSRGDI